MILLIHRRPRYRPGQLVVHQPTNRTGLVVAVLPDGQRLVAFPGRTRIAPASQLPARDLRPGVDLAA